MLSAMSTGERGSWVFAAIGATMVALPFVAEDALKPMGDARFAMMMVGAVIALSAPFIALLYRSRNRVRRQLLAGAGLLVHWTYSEAEWRAFAGEETARQSSGKRTLLLVTAGIMIVVTVGFIALDRQAGLAVGAVLFVVWILCWFAARASVRAKACAQVGGAPEVRIGKDGLLIGNELHIWRSWGNRLEGCALIEGQPRLIEISYSIQGKNSRHIETVRAPIPVGKEAEAIELVRQLQA